MTVRSILLLTALATLVLSACQTEEPGQTYEARGVFLGTQYGGEAALIDHEDIPGYMGPMRMAFRVADTSLVSGLEPDTPISFRLVVKEDGVVVDEIETLPEGTMLKLAGSDMDTTMAMPMMEMNSDSAMATP